MNGLVHIYCGEGKGKTTAAVGLAVRAAGNGMKVLFLQFMKGGETGELESFKKLGNITVLRGKGSMKFAWNMTEEEKADACRIQEANFEKAIEKAGDYDLLILDEAVGTCAAGFLNTDKVCKFLDNRPAGLEVVLTGRNPSEELLRRADYVSEIKKVKHPYDKGIKARKGIER